jgi:Chalcone isomerase-like
MIIFRILALDRYVSRLLLSAIIILLLPVCVQALINEALPKEDMQALEPLGHGKLSFFGLPVYDATLYTESPNFTAQQLTDARYALALRYARELDGKKIAERTEAEMAKQAKSTEAERKAWLVQMKALFPSVRKGDVLTGMHTPNKGTQFFLNGKRLGEIEGARFAQVFFGIWLADTTSEPSLRRALLTPHNTTKAP